jgi:hypothetical protein
MAGTAPSAQPFVASSLNPQSPIPNRQSAIPNPQSSISNPRSRFPVQGNRI